MDQDLAATIRHLAEQSRAASLQLAVASTESKNRALLALASKIESSQPALLAANSLDLEAGRAAGLSAALLDRLTLNEARIRQIAQGVREIVALADPVGAELERTLRPNGLVIRKLRVPIGVIAIIYESRPNVTIDCAALCLKSGNATILRGGKEAFHSNTALAALIAEALSEAGLPASSVQLVPTTDRGALNTLLKLNELVHCVIPRGGEPLIRFVSENSTIPVIKHYKGVCFVYVDRAADLAVAEPLLVNAKVQRPSACNAADQSSRNGGVQLRCDPASAAILASAGLAYQPATDDDYRTEFLDYILAVRVVDSLDSAIATINRDSSNHSDSIVTTDEAAARRFQAEVDSATVYWNASTRFTDGFEFGLGAEIGISTDRLHARGPMGLAELCSYKFVIDGTGQVRS
jgi:glutamate-5-semialdehyde dehydrogenase